MEEIADPANLEGIDNDPVAMGRMLKKMKKQMGEEIAPEFDEVVNRLEKGQSPEQIEKELPDLSNPPDGGGGMPDANDDMEF